MSIHVYPRLELVCGACHERVEVELLEAGAAQKIVCPACGEESTSAGDLELLNAFARIPEVLSYAQGTFRFVALRDPDIEIEEQEEAAASEAEEERWQAALTACREQRWTDAFKIAVELARARDDAQVLVETAWCPHCRRKVPKPSQVIGVDSARYYRGQCPTCETPFRLTP